MSSLWRKTMTTGSHTTPRHDPIATALSALEHEARRLPPYDAAAQEAWFDTARQLLAQVSDERERVAWIITLAHAYTTTVGAGLPLSLVQSRLAKLVMAGLLAEAIDIAHIPCC